MKPLPEVIIIAAVARNGVIGRNNSLPWRLKADLAYFKATTSGHPILMGRKTWESLGRPLPGRRNLVISRNPDYHAAGAEVFCTPEDALATVPADEKIFVIGGAELYRQMLPMAGSLLLTCIQAEVEGDAVFPLFDHNQYIETLLHSHPADADNEFACHFFEYRRK